jgi:hypothetical protein
VGTGGGAAALVALMLVGVTLDVILRNVLVTGIPGIVEYTGVGLYLATVFAAPWLLHRGQHIRADLLGQWATGAWLKAVDALGDLIGLLVSLVVAGTRCNGAGELRPGLDGPSHGRIPGMVAHRAPAPRHGAARRRVRTSPRPTLASSSGARHQDARSVAEKVAP